MSEPFLGQIMLVGFNFAPQGWAFCNGQLLSSATGVQLEWREPRHKEARKR